MSDYQHDLDGWDTETPFAVPIFEQKQSPDLTAFPDPESALWNRRSSQELEAALLAHGITRDKTVVLRGRYATPDPAEKARQVAAALAAGFAVDYQDHKPARSTLGLLASSRSSRSHPPWKAPACGAKNSVDQPQIESFAQ